MRIQPFDREQWDIRMIRRFMIFFGPISSILLNNLMYDTGEMTIPTDTVDADLLRRPEPSAQPGTITASRAAATEILNVAVDSHPSPPRA